jgi:hypothetical protein
MFDLPWLALGAGWGPHLRGPIRSTSIQLSVRVLFVPESLRLVNRMFGTFSGTHPRCSLVMQNIFDPRSGRFSDTFWWASKPLLDQ